MGCIGLRFVTVLPNHRISKLGWQHCKRDDWARFRSISKMLLCNAWNSIFHFSLSSRTNSLSFPNQGTFHCSFLNTIPLYKKKDYILSLLSHYAMNTTTILKWAHIQKKKKKYKKPFVLSLSCLFCWIILF